MNGKCKYFERENLGGYKMKLLKKISTGVTLGELVKMAEENGLPLDSKISIMGAEACYILEDNGVLLLDEKNCIEEL